MNTLELLVIKILVFLKNKKKQFKLKKNLNNSSFRYFNHNNYLNRCQNSCIPYKTIQASHYYKISASVQINITQFNNHHTNHHLGDKYKIL